MSLSADVVEQAELPAAPAARVFNLVDYVGVKQLRAVPLSLGDYNLLREWDMPEGEDPLAPGYLVEYTDGGMPNTTMFAGYISWSPKDVFERSYRVNGGLGSFSNGLDALKSGYRIARLGWNGKGMWLCLSPGATGVPYEQFWAHHNRDFAAGQPGQEATVRPYITMKTAQDDIVPWVASQSDLLADDWVALI